MEITSEKKRDYSGGGRRDNKTPSDVSGVHRRSRTFTDVHSFGGGDTAEVVVVEASGRIQVDPDVSGGSVRLARRLLGGIGATDRTRPVSLRRETHVDTLTSVTHGREHAKKKYL